MMRDRHIMEAGVTAIPSGTAALKFPAKPGPRGLAITPDGKHLGTPGLDAVSLSCTIMG
jgi:hypothetical protein